MEALGDRLQWGDPQVLTATLCLGFLGVVLLFALLARTVGPAASFAAIVQMRYACKEFDALHPIKEETLASIMALAQRAPTSFNTQPWIAVVVRDPAVRAKLEQAMVPGNQLKVASAPVNVVFAADLEPERLLTASTPDFIREALPKFMGLATSPEAWAFKQTMMAVQTFLLAATAHGVQTGPMEGFRSVEAVRDAVGLPPRYSVPVVVALGYEKAPRAKLSPRYPLEAVFHFDGYGRLR
jgi:nitroreductase